MGVKLQLMLGVVLALSICASTDASTRRQIRQISDTWHIYPMPRNVAFDRDLNLIEKTPKTETEQKTVQNTQNNVTSVKLNKSEPYVKVTSDELDDKKGDNENVVEKEPVKFNIINHDNSEINREASSRSIDINIDKYVSPEFHSKNNVYTLPVSAVNQKYVDESFPYKSSTVFPPKSSTADFSSFDVHSDLTTPKTDFFDEKFKEAVHSIDQILEHLDNEENEHENPKDVIIEKVVTKTKNVPNITVNYKETKTILNNNNINKSSEHADLSVEQTKKIDFDSKFNDTITYEELSTKGDLEKLETTTSRTYLPSTRKPVSLTKPPINRNNSDLLSNKIEIETIKSINVATSELPTTKQPKGEISITVSKRGSTKYPDTVTESYKSKEQVVLENQIIPIQVTLPGTTTDSLTSTANTEKHLGSTPAKYSTNIVEQTTYENSHTDVTTAEESSTTSFETSTMTKGFETTSKGSQGLTSTLMPDESTTLMDETTTVTDEITTVTSETSTTAEDVQNDTDMISATEELTTPDVTSSEMDNKETTWGVGEISEKTTVKVYVDASTKEAQTVTGTSSETVSTEQSTILLTRETEEMTSTTENLPTTEIEELRTTKNEPEAQTSDDTDRTSKHIVFETTTTTENLDDTTTETTTLGTTENEVLNITFRPNSVKIITITPNTTNATTLVSPTTATTNTVFHQLNKTSSSFPVTTILTTMSTTVGFVHVKNVDSTHTTLIPDILSPNFSYPSPVTQKHLIETTDEPMGFTNTTTEGGEEGTETSSGTENAITDGNESNKGTIAAITISTVGAVCLVLLAGLLYVMRKRQKRFNYGQRCRPVSLDDYSMDNVSVHNSVRRKGLIRASKRSYGNPAFEDPVAVTHPLNFPALAKFATNAEDIKAEFEEIPQITARTSELPEGCETKNRYANVIPLPETRVFLKAIDGYPNSDYINANYVSGPKNTKGYYIACQGPLQNTVDDFWRMVWEQQSKVILMLTHLFENGVEKCVDYLPPSEVLDCHRLFGDFQVTLKKRDVKDKYIISCLQLKNMVSNSWREITHFWYLGWPEKGVPTEGNSLIAFLIEARSYMKSSTLDKAANGNMQNGNSPSEVNPVVVHCSPGTGRTGVAIACDVAIREFEQTRLVDVPRIVYRIRRDRANAVQTREQYMFIYKVVSLYATKLTGGALDSF